MPFVIRQIAPPGKSARADEASAVALTSALLSGHKVEGDYLAWYDVEAYGGRGADRWTADVSKAIRFPTFEAAMELWRTQSKRRPYRPDGKPNRPLTAYSITVEQVP
jgi:hypothetical protein